ncbi:MAG: hypothetical protein D6776_10885 [Planctomycetota bacterium]|nr:MAG: hypothetical protein D6776_10885 [Planctomycetota bacterium]
MLHAGNEVRFDRVPSTAEPLTLEARVASVDANERRTIVLVRTVHRDESGSQLFTVDTTLFFPGAAPREAGSKQKKTEKKDTVRVPFGAREIHRFRVRLADSRAYAAVSGDFNPVHISHLAARLSGFRGAFAHGYAIKARIAHRLIHTALGGEPTRLERLAVRFRRPVYLETETGIYLAEERDDPAGGRRAELYVGPGPGESAQVSGEAHWSA